MFVLRICVPLFSFLFPFPNCLQKKWRKLFESTGEFDEEKDVFYKFNKSVKQETSLNVTLPEDPRTRRRRLYKLASEPKPKFPFQPRNFYSQVIENKEVMKTLSLLSTCTNQIKPVCYEHFVMIAIKRGLIY